MVSLSTEQFQELLSAVGRPNEKCGSFSSCSARYGGERNPSKVEEFISAISTFKLVEKIPDPDAVNGMPMLLKGDDAEWWRGVKANVQSFDDVVRMLRESFCPPKPVWRIYVEIHESKQQKNEPTDSFIRKKRALFAQLPNCPAESDQLDMIFENLCYIRRFVNAFSAELTCQILNHMAIFKDAIPTDMVTPDRSKDNGLFTGVVYRPPKDDDEQMFTPLYAFDYKILKPTDGAQLSENQKMQLDETLFGHNAVFGSFGKPSPNAVHRIDTVLVTTHVLSNVSKGITSKFVPKRDGPYILTKKIGSSSYEVSSPDNLTIPLGTYHTSALTLYTGTNARNNPAPVHLMKRRGRPRKA
ncbi:hypothetical protein CVS40_11130 [Lucilia cuprina]|nr:hypothetical protein CVS40_11130 [Lucilia cuprina]